MDRIRAEVKTKLEPQEKYVRKIKHRNRKYEWAITSYGNKMIIEYKENNKNERSYWKNMNNANINMKNKFEWVYSYLRIKFN